MEKLCAGLDPTWFVGPGDEPNYRKAGAKFVIGHEHPLPDKAYKLNKALGMAFAMGLPLFNLDDDLNQVKISQQQGDKIRSKPVDMHVVLKELLKQAKTSKFKLVGPAPLTNAFFVGTGIKNFGSVQGKAGLHLPNDLRYDEAMLDYEDTKYAIQHHLTYGGVTIVNKVLIGNQQRAAEGGYTKTRNRKSLEVVAAKINEEFGDTGAVKAWVDEKGIFRSKVLWWKLADIGRIGKKGFFQQR
jgi:hypothetical protein